LEKLEDNNFIEAVTLARLIWLRRNTLVFEGFFTPPSNLVGQAKNQVAEFAQAIDQSETCCAGAVKPTPTWTPPPPGMLKANWDAAVDCKQKLVGIGVVIRTHEGTVQAAYSASEQGITDLATTEVLAA
jgi:hypothetical protein